VNDENKYSYWVFTIQGVNGDDLVDQSALVKTLDKLTEKYLFQRELAASPHYQGCCKTRIRKRQQTFLKDLVKDLEIPLACVTINKMEGTWDQAVLYCSKLDTKAGDIVTNIVSYSGDDIKVIDDADGRYPWQDKIINEIIDESQARVKDTDDRSIIWIQDSKGGNGKSKLVKWCCFRYNDIIKISFGTSNQLRSALIAAGAKRAYFIDVPRTLGSDDSLASLMSALEDLKNGFIVSAMYGKHQSLLLDPPHIVVFSNDTCPERYMSTDRWKIYTINYERDFIVRKGDTYVTWEDQND